MNNGCLHTRCDSTESEAIFVGDDPRWDVLGAESVGLHPLLLLNGSAVGSTSCTVIARLDDVLSWIKVAG